MASPLPEPEVEWVTCGKMPHVTAAEAEAHRASHMRTVGFGRNTRRGSRLEVYRCDIPGCGAFHIGRNRPGRKGSTS